MYILILEEIGRAVVNALRTLSFTIFDALLTGINIVYNFFMKLATYRLLDDSTITDLYTRIGLILGLFMVFRLTFSAIEYLINPDTMTDKTKGIGNIVKKVLIMIALLGSVHFLFDKAYDLQDLLLKGSNNIMSKLILNEVSKDSEEDDNEEDGKKLSWTIFKSFYTFNKDNICSDENSKFKSYCPNGGIDFDTMLYTHVKERSDMSLTYALIEKGEERIMKTSEGTEEDSYVYLVNFDWFYGIACAAAVLWVLIVYVIQLGVRVIQLAYLEIIAPIPIMMYLTPKGDETLKKWGQQCLTTFLDAFIRIAILYFIILIVDTISGSSLPTGGLSTGIVLILGLFMFAKKVPDLLGELFPSMGGKAGLGFGFGMPKEAKQLGLFGAGAVLGTAGAATSNLLHGANATRNAWKESKGFKGKMKALGKGIGGTGLSVVGGAVSGFHHGARIKNLKGVGSTIKTTNANREKRDLKQAAGYHVWDAAGDKVKGFAGDTTVAEQKIKTAQFRQQALQSSQSMQWENFAESHANDPNVDLSLLRSMQEFEENGKKVWRGIDKDGNERKFTYASGTFTDIHDNTNTITGDSADMVENSATIDKKVKEQGKIIKGLEAAKTDAEK